MAKILVLGADGMVGHMLRIYLSEVGHEVVSLARTANQNWAGVDAEDPVALLGYLEKARPELVVNGIGVLIQDSENDPLRALRLNAVLPRLLEKWGPILGFHTIQLSSDCVFSGNHGPYVESALRDADEVYGRTKALGELKNSRDLTIRTSKVGPELSKEGSGLFNWFMNKQGETNGFCRAMWGGVTTLELAKFINYYTRSPAVGLYHLTNGEPISKWRLLCLFKEIWKKLDIEISPIEGKASDRSLRTERNDIQYHVPSYEEMLTELHSFMQDHVELYPHYWHEDK